MTFPRVAMITFVLLATAAGAQVPDPCRMDARAAFRGCKQTCRDAYRNTKDTCTTRDPVCVDACRAQRDECRAPFEAQLAAAVAACDDALRGAKRLCRQQFGDGTMELDGCIDQAQRVAFACRDTARESVADSLQQCRDGLQSCVRSNCPREAVGDPAAFRACRLDARDVLQLCGAGCREALQLDKDTCLDRDHACVETCRATRTACRAPVLQVFEDALTTCAAGRQSAMDVCRSLYAADSPERDSCIDQAQLDAFSCRDAAREAAKPGLQSCRDAFLACAEACPPPGASPNGAFVR